MSSHPRIDDDAFFAAIDPTRQAITRAIHGTFPWEGVIEDRFAAEEHVRALYAKAGLKPPRTAWAASPASLRGAQTMLRTINTKSKHAMITELVPMGERIETEVRRTLLNAILDPNLTVTTGADLTTAMNWRLILKWTRYRDMQPLTDIRGILRGDEVYSPLYSELIGAIAMQSFCIKPYVHICWLCLPPLFIKTDEDGFLHCDDGPAVKFSDGFEIWHKHVKEEPELLEGEYLDELPSGEVLGLPAPKEEEDVS